MASSVNKAAWYRKQATPLDVADAPYPRAGAGELVVKVVAAGLNPVDYKIIASGKRINVFPNVLGQNAAGVVVEVGEGVADKFTVGDRVVGHFLSVLDQRASEGAFQLYAIARPYALAPIPASLSFEEAAVLPLALTTATVGLFTKDQLALSLPSAKASAKQAVVLVWGGSSSVGAVAIQLLRLAGYRVITTASPRNADFCRELGAEGVFDYNSARVIDEIVSALSKEDVAGAFNSIDEASAAASAEILSRVATASGKTLHVASVSELPSKQAPAGVTFKLLGGAANMWGDDRKDIANYIWEDFLPGALATGALRAVPPPLLVPGGLESIQKGLAILEKGVSAKKVVVQIQEP